jgi:CRP-like cAMP-binding protein
VLVNQDQIRLLKKNTLFKGVPEEYLNSSLKPKNFIKVEDGEILYSSNEESSAVYLIIEGEIKIKFYKEKKIEHKILFDFFGEAEILKKSKRNSCAVADSEGILYKMSISELKNLFGVSKSLTDNLSRKNVRQIDEYNEGEITDLDSALDDHNSNKDSEIIDFDREQEEEMINEVSQEDLSAILEKQRSKNNIDNDLNDKKKFEDENSEDFSSDKSKANE